MNEDIAGTLIILFVCLIIVFSISFIGWHKDYSEFTVLEQVEYCNKYCVKNGFSEGRFEMSNNNYIICSCVVNQEVFELDRYNDYCVNQTADRGLIIHVS